MCLTSHCCRRGGKTSEGRETISGRAEQTRGPAGWAGLFQHVRNTCLHPGANPGGATNAENQSRWLNGVGHSSPRAGGSRPPGYGYNTLVPLPSHPALTTRAKHPSGIYGWMVDQTQAGPFQVSRANSQWIHFSMKYFCGNHVLGNHKSSFLKAAWSLYPLSN